MKSDRLNLKFRGHIIVTSNKDGVVYNNSNAIGINALEIITRCLTQLDLPKAVDKIKATGLWGTHTADISQVSYDSILNTITFSAVFFENDFNGDITDLELQCSALGNKLMATKTGLSITKDDATRVRIDWKLIIVQC